MQLFLDTNIISELRLSPSKKINPTFAKWAEQIDRNHCWTSAVVMMEIERGVIRMERKDALQGQNLRLWLEHFAKPFFEDRIFKIDRTTAEICAKLHVPNMRPESDAWIAASCIQHNLTLVTRNVADFQNLGIELINPFE
ncbi:MAG: type II toxin-antitoxin system VapC family toxin [Neisseriaceae bacterium]|nr:type II toxin-antitoxin system VapC family toxin [Neisseriaceae bacterium]